jgi:DNA-binding GntR family transcriptional regulator
VTKLTLAEIRQILRIRSELETLAVELAIENASGPDLDKLRDLTALMEEAARARNVHRFFSLDLRFHETLWRLSGNSFLPRLLAQALMPLLAFLFIRNLRNHRNIDMLDSARAHAEIVEAIRTRDKAAARKTARQKFRMFAEQHLDWYDSKE